MLINSKPKKQFKSQNKSSLPKRQSSRQTNQQLTARLIKQPTKNNTHQQNVKKPQRSSQIIKLMISQLEKQLMSKTKAKKSFQNSVQQFSKTKRKFHSNNNKTPQITLKATFAEGTTWKSPTKKKQKNSQVQMNCKPLTKNQLPQKSFSKKKKPSSQKPTLPQSSNNHTLKLTSKTHKTSKPSKQNYAFLGDDLIHFSNLKVPLFIVENKSQLLQKSVMSSSRNEKMSQMIVDQKQSFMRHSKIPSFDSVNTERSRHVKFIERSFCESHESDEETGDNVDFFELNLFEKKNYCQNKQMVSNQAQPLPQIKRERKASINNQTFDINKIILLNNSVLKIQRWWRKSVQQQKLNAQKQQQAIKQSLQTIQTKQQQSQKHIFESIKQNNQLNQIKYHQPSSLSQKQICTSQSNDHSDILKLRQNAAYLQFSTHQQILKQLLNKGKITKQQFEQKISHIKLNLSQQLNDIQKIRTILQQSAQKVQNMMKKTNEDIMVVKKIVLDEKETYTNNLNRQSSSFQREQKENILTTIFGQTHSIPKEQEKQHSQQQSLKQKLSSKQQNCKIPTYQHQLQQFINRPSQEQQQNSFLSQHNSKIFNSPNTGSEENLPSPDSKYEPQHSEQQQQYEDIFSSQIQHVPSGSTQTSPFPITANFQQLYKQYQQQQQTKKQIESRIARQLGVSQPQFLLTSQKQNQISITTSIVAIHKFLLNFFKFYLYYHKNDFLTYMNMPYGESIETRLTKNKLNNCEQALQQWTKTTFYTDDDQEIIYGLKSVIPQSILEDFFQSYYEQTDIQFTEVQKTNIELQKIHNRAVFQAFNQGLNFFRPYYNIGGAPYLWCSSQKSLTFYCIGQDNIQEVYEKTQMKILKTASHLCGVLVDVPHKNKVLFDKFSNQKQQCFEIESPFKVMENKQRTYSKEQKKINNFQEYLQTYTQNFNAAYLINLQEKLKKKQLAQTEEQNLEWFGNTFQEGKVATLLNLTELIEEMILLEECSILQKIHANQQTMVQELSAY